MNNFEESGTDTYDLIVKKVEEKVLNTADILNETIYKMDLVDGVGINKITIVQANSFFGFKPGDVVQIRLKKTQKTLTESIPMPKDKEKKSKS
jgi:hypothetical protein